MSRPPQEEYEMDAVAQLFAVTVDCPEPVALARFYQGFAGGEVLVVGDDFAVLTGGACRIDFQRVSNPRPVWPGGDAARRVHLDFRVEEIAPVEAHVQALGAVLAGEQPGGRRFRVFIDPAGHPFCLVAAEASVVPPTAVRAGNARLEAAFRELPPGGWIELAGQGDGDREALVAAGFVAIETAGGTVRARKPSAPPGVTIRPMRADDAARVLAIYQEGIDGGQSSFETEAPDWAGFDRAKLPRHRFVAADDETGEVLGWVAAIATSDRCAYAGVVEHSVYVDPASGGRGIGGALLEALIGSTEAAGVWTIQSGVFPENTVSLRLHERAGFRVVGTRTRVGRHHGHWRDVVLIERRSAVAGTD